MNNRSSKSVLWLNRIKLAALFVIPVILLILPKDFFDNGQTICISKALFDTTCPGCGMTRAVMHLVHLDVAAASSFNPGVFVVLPLLIILWFRMVRSTYQSLRMA